MKRALILTAALLLCLSLLTLSAIAAVNAKLVTKSSRVITYGDKDTPNGLFWSGGAYNPAKGISGKNVILRYRVRGTNTWNTDLVLPTGANGVFSTEYSPTYNTHYQAYFPGDADYNVTTGNIATTFVRVKITMVGEKTSNSYKISGEVSPSKAKRKVLVKIKKKGKGWMTAKRLRLNNDSSYQYEYKFKRLKKGKYFIRVIYNGDSRNKSNVSEAGSFTIE